MSTASPVQSIARYCERICRKGKLHDEYGEYGAVVAVDECRKRTCPLHPFRLARNPNRAGIGGRPKKNSQLRAV